MARYRLHYKGVEVLGTTNVYNGVGLDLITNHIDPVPTGEIRMVIVDKTENRRSFKEICDKLGAVPEHRCN
jgi:hypothetical protein